MLSLDNLPVVVTLLIALSVATERLVEIVKGFFWQLSESRDDPKAEARRRVILHFLAVAGGFVITLVAWPAVAEVLRPAAGPAGAQAAQAMPIPGGSKWATIAALGLLASGGSGFWNTMLTYVLNLKDLKKASVQAAQQAVEAGRPLPQPVDAELRGA